MVKRVVAINDLSGLGKCSLTVVIPVLSALGVQACPLPTAVFSNQTGYPHFFCRDLTEDMRHILQEWKSLGFHFDGIYTGFLSHENQVSIIEECVKTFKTKTTLFLVDPVMGDDGEIYPNFSPRLIERMKELASMADIITPNLTECCILTGSDYHALMNQRKQEDYLEIVSTLCQKLLRGNVKQAVVTGIRYQGKEDKAEMLYNAVIEGEQVSFVKGDITGGSYSGTGDLLASIICGMLLRGTPLVQAVEFATDFIHLAVEDAYKNHLDRNDGVNFEKFMDRLTGQNSDGPVDKNF